MSMNLFKILGTIAVENDKANREIDETADKAEGAEGKISGAFKKIGGAVATYFAVDKIIDFGKEVVNVAAEVAAETSAFEQIMGSYTDKAAKKVDKIADATGMVNTRLTPYMTSMTAKFKGLGYDVSDATDYAARGLNLAADASAFWDKSIDESMSHLNSFINGSYEGGEAIGLFANDTQMASYAVKTGLIDEAKEWSSLDEARKQATRLEYAENMMKASGATGQAAKEAGQYANVQANLTEKWRQFKAQIGEPLLQNVVLPAMEKLGDVVDFASEKFPGLMERAGQAKDKLLEIGDYAEQKFKPAFEKISDAVGKVKEALQPFIDKLKEYFSSGEASEDATNLLKDAVDFLAGALDTALSAVESVVDTFKDMKKWASENETALTLIGVAVGTLTAAITAYNIAMAIKNAGGIVEIAQLAATAIGVGALTVAETAHTVASTVAAAATTAFGAAVSFLTSPITLVILAIGALIAIGVLLYKNWDKIKAKCSELYSNLKEKFAKIKESVTKSVTDLKNKAVEKFNSLKQSAIDKVNSLKQSAIDKFNSLKTGAIEKFNSLKTGAIEKFNSLKSSAINKFNEIKNGILKPIETAKTKFKSIVDTIKGFFSGMKLRFPSIKLPHFSISPSGWKIGDLLEGSIPSLGIEWYAKAMNNPMLMTSPTIFGYNPATGAVMGGGEAGSEVVAGTNTLMNMIGQAVAQNSNSQSDRIVKLLTALLEAIISSNKDLLAALLAGQKIVLNGRELGRTVREYA